MSLHLPPHAITVAVFALMILMSVLVTCAQAIEPAVDSAPLYGPIKPMKAGDVLYVFDKGNRANARQVIAIQTLQGTLARLEGPRIWINAGDKTFVDYFTKTFDVRFDDTFKADWAGLIEKFKPSTSGKYVLYDLRDRPSLSAANTVAGLIDGIAIDIAQEAIAKEKGYTLGVDVRGKSSKWVWETYKDQISRDGIVVHTNNPREHPSIDCLIDWSPATRQIAWWYKDEKLSREVYSSMKPVSPVYGWQDPNTPDEGLTVKIHSETGLYQIPSDWMLNLSVHASTGPVMKDESFHQKVERKPVKKEEGVHYVTFILSDMDNILTEIGTNSFFTEKKFYANKHRGEFPMGWGMAPALTELSPAGLKMWYDAATPNDAFVGYCGMGYFYPNVAPALDKHMKRLEPLLKRADLRTMLLIDRVKPDKEFTKEYYEPFAKRFTGMEQIRGLYYMEYVQYAPHEGKIFWYDDKPMVCARFDFRQDAFYSAVRKTPKDLAESINALPRDPSDPNSYTFVTVLAWSKSLDDVKKTIDLLDKNVRVVNAEEFIEQLRSNIPAEKRK
jgi:hypothetical protein